MNENEPEECLPESDYNRILEWQRQQLEKQSTEFEKKLPKIFQNQYAILDESGNVIKASLLEWGAWFEKNNGQRYICFDSYNQDQYRVSTVFLGLNHNYSPKDKPQWFETMVFGPAEMKELLGKMTEVREDLWMSQCETLTEAKAMHIEGIAWLKENYSVTHDGGDHSSGSSSSVSSYL